MYWWSQFDSGEIKRDFEQIARLPFAVVRIFLLWEDFQPDPVNISQKALTNLRMVADIASSYGLKLMPTFFCGHMSGINWFPRWMLKDEWAPQRFPVYSAGCLVNQIIRNYYCDEEVINAQTILIREVCTALKDHPAIYAYDLGNEASNCVIPPNRKQARHWLEIMSKAIKKYSNGCLLTLGMHAEDLEEDRHLWPQDAAKYCDFLSMHAYPFYLSWVKQALDANILPFMGAITAWLGGKPVMLQEFGAPSEPVLEPLLTDSEKSQLQSPLFTEKEVADYYQNALILLKDSNILGALAWCYSDYAPHLWSKPPLQQKLHERYFGLMRFDGTAKPSAAAWAQATNKTLTEKIDISWLAGFEPDHFYTNPRENLIKLYDLYRQQRRHEISDFI